MTTTIKSIWYLFSIFAARISSKIDVYPGKSSLLVVLLLSYLFTININIFHIADYNFTMLYVPPPVPEYGDIDYLVSRSFARSDRWVCLNNAHRPGDSGNRATNIINRTESALDPEFLAGNTYWFNEYMHVGHVTFDSVLIQILKTTKIDRVVMQRAACHATLCFGVGTWRSFYAAYFAAAFEAVNQSNIPIYIRWASGERSLTPNHVSTRIDGYENYQIKNVSPKTIPIKPNICLEHVIRRGPKYWGNFHGSKSPEAIQGFKRAAYGAKSVGTPVLTTHFVASSPCVILFSYRGIHSSRHMTNSSQSLLIHGLHQSFPAPLYDLRIMNNGNQSNTAEGQLRAVAEANVVITNHGAFEGNLIYMRNASLLVELAGNYTNSEFRFFQHLSHDFGVFYARLRTYNLQDHDQASFDILSTEIDEIVGIVREYFMRKPYAFNIK